MDGAIAGRMDSIPPTTVRLVPTPRKVTRRMPPSTKGREAAPRSGRNSIPIATETVKMKEPMPTAPVPVMPESEGLLASTVVK